MMRSVTQLLVAGSVPIGLLASPAGAAAPTAPAGNETAPDSRGPVAEATSAPTGDPIIDRLNRLEARVRQLEARNAELEEKAKAGEARLEAAEKQSDKAVRFGWGPSFSDPSGDFTFKPRGVVEADVAAFAERRGGYDYNNGTAFRRARIGFEGTALKTFNYRIEADFAGNAVNLTDAYLQYVGIPRLAITLGQHKAPFGLESNNSDNYNVFLERGMFTNAFGNVGAERRIGASVAYGTDTFNAAIGLFGDNESISRSTTSPVTDTPDESWGVNGRVTWEPLFQPGKILQVGASGYYRTSLKSGDVADAVRLADRPNVRIDNGNIADSGVITDVESLRYGGLEAAGIFGPVSLVGEYGRLWLDRPGLDDKTFDGFYVYGSWFLTGETRPFKNGNFDRVKPSTNLGKDGLGAFEFALRYDKLDLSNTPVLGRGGNKSESLTLGLNWYFNPYAKLMVNWVRFNGDNTPLDPVGDKVKGDAVASRLHLDF